MTKISSNKKQQGFTLAEVLVTLAVIGIVAALTIPSLVKGYQQKQFNAEYKKAASVFNSALNMYQSDHGGSLISGCTSGDTECFLNELTPYLKLVKTCGNGSYTDCFVDRATMKTLHGTTAEETVMNNSPCWTLGTRMFAVLADGTAFCISYRLDTPDNDYDGHLGIDLGGDAIGGFLIDVNGDNEPNTLGKDINCAIITDKGLAHCGNTYPCDQNSTNGYNGLGCAKKIMLGEDF